MGFTIDRKAPRVSKGRGRPMAHGNDGWPHFSSSFPYLCMCLQACCQGESGCRCKACACMIEGIEHGGMVESGELLREIALRRDINLRDEDKKARKRPIKRRIK